MERLRVDKWLWAARFFKSRSLASQAVEGGKVKVNGARVKPAREIRVGDRLEITLADIQWEITVARLSDRRGPASVAQTLYQESESSRRRREAMREARRYQTEPAQALHGRPTKRDRRQLERLRGK